MDNLKVSKGVKIGLDVGGTLAKLVMFFPKDYKGDGANKIENFIKNSNYYGTSGFRSDELILTTGIKYFFLLHLYIFFQNIER